MHLLSGRVGGKLPCARASVDLAITVTKIEIPLNMRCAPKIRFWHEWRTKKRKNEFWPRICIWVENEQKKVKFALRSTKNPQRCQISKIFRSLPRFCTNLRGTFGDLQGTGCTFPEPWGKLRGTFGQASGSHLAASKTSCGRFSWKFHFVATLRPICVKNVNYLGGGGLRQIFWFFSIFANFWILWETLHVGGVCMVTFAPSFGNSSQCVCVYIYICVCVSLWRKWSNNRTRKKNHITRLNAVEHEHWHIHEPSKCGFGNTTSTFKSPLAVGLSDKNKNHKCTWTFPML